MNRRKFFKNSALFSVPLFLRGIPVFADADLHPFLDALARPAIACDKILVIVQMNGGNDGLNMVIPLDRYAQLSNARPGLLIPQSSVLPLNGTKTSGFHPSMTGMKNMYDAGRINIVQGVSYPNPNFSHFHAQDIWFTGGDSGQNLDTGWMGRQLDEVYPGYPDGYPNSENRDPPAIQIGGALALSLQGAGTNMGYNVPNPAALLNVVNATSGPAPQNDYGNELTFLRLMKEQSNAYTNRISNAYNAQATLSSMYASSGNSLSDQLKIVARLIGGGLSTPVYIVNHSDSFDTHVNQVASGNPTTGNHANNLAKLSVAIAAFQNDITLMGKADRVTGMTFSEFGRRVISNASNGTDHGTAAPVIFFGAGVRPGIIGSSPDLPARPDAGTQVPTQYDFRQLYASVMQNWLCMSSSQSDTILNGHYNTLAIFNTNGVALPLTGIEVNAFWQENKAVINFNVNDNNQYQEFTIERSGDAVRFTEVGTIKQDSDHSFSSYTFKDERILTSRCFYRIKGTTKAGELSNSNVVKLENDKQTQQVSIYPNPVKNHLIHINFFKETNENVEIAIFSSGGQRLYYNQLRPQGGNTLQVPVPDLFISKQLYIIKLKFDFTEIVEKIMFE